MDSTVRILQQEIASILRADVSGVVTDAPLHELGMDSMSFVELLVFIEKKFKINLIESGLNRQDFLSIDTLSKRIDQSCADRRQ